MTPETMMFIELGTRLNPLVWAATAYAVVTVVALLAAILREMRPRPSARRFDLSCRRIVVVPPPETPALDEAA